jgi:hypothetical protein
LKYKSHGKTNIDVQLCADSNIVLILAFGVLDLVLHFDIFSGLCGVASLSALLSLFLSGGENVSICHVDPSIT